MNCFELVKEEIQEFCERNGYGLNERNLRVLKEYCRIIDDNLEENYCEYFETEIEKSTGLIIMRFRCMYYTAGSGLMFEIMKNMVYMGFQNVRDQLRVTFVFPGVFTHADLN